MVIKCVLTSQIEVFQLASRSRSKIEVKVITFFVLDLVLGWRCHVSTGMGLLMMVHHAEYSRKSYEHNE